MAWIGLKIGKTFQLYSWNGINPIGLDIEAGVQIQYEHYFEYKNVLLCGVYQLKMLS